MIVGPEAPTMGIEFYSLGSILSMDIWLLTSLLNCSVGDTIDLIDGLQEENNQ
jgi:hypothetical protein